MNQCDFRLPRVAFFDKHAHFSAVDPALCVMVRQETDVAARQYEGRCSLDAVDMRRDAVVLIAQEKEVLELKEGPNDLLRVPDLGK